MFLTFIDWTRDSWIGVAGREISWVFPAAEIVHFFGLSLFIGAIIVVDLRLLGYGKSLSLQAMQKLIPLTLVGLLLNFMSGIVFLCTYPENYWPSITFWIKLLAIAIGLLNAVWFKKFEAPALENLPPDGDVKSRTKMIAWISLITWTVVISAGRFLPFVSVSTG